MSEKLQQLKEILGEVSDLRTAYSVLGWDQQTYMPPGGAEARGHQLGTLGKLAQIKFTSDEVGRLLEDLKSELGGEQSLAALDSDEAALVRVTARDFDKARRVPPEFVVEQALVTTRAFEAWRKRGRNPISRSSSPISKRCWSWCIVILISFRRGSTSTIPCWMILNQG